MTTFTRTWNAAYEANPADTQNASQGALRIRDFKTDVKERMEVDHEWGGEASSTNDSGFHTAVHLQDNSTNPSADAGSGIIFTKLSNGVIELFYREDSGAGGTVTQLTQGGAHALLSSNNVWTGSNTASQHNIGSVSGNFTPDYNDGNSQRFTMTADAAMQVPSNGVAGAVLQIEAIQGDDNLDLTFASAIKKGVYVDRSNSDDNGDVDLYVLYYSNAGEWNIISVTQSIGS